MRIKSIVAGLCLVVFAGCHAEDAPLELPTEATIVGTYSLAVVNGLRLPFPIGSDGVRRVEVASGSLTLRPDHTFTDVLVTRLIVLNTTTDPVVQTDTRTGTWQFQGSTLTLVFPGIGQQTAAVTQSKVTKNESGLLFTYER